MCGIAGFIEVSASRSIEDLQRIVQSMSDCLRLRGPDSSGTWVDPQNDVALGHRRLSIVDLSPEGHQPMHSADQRFVIVFNGEIYNFPELQKELASAGHRFRGHSDTEVMLAAFVQWGLLKGLKRFVGMFAFALWDRRERKLTLARDRMGEKPLYYGWQNGVFLFASELNALREHPRFSAQINRNALALMLRHNYVPAPHSMYQGINKLSPGAFIELDPTKPNVKPTEQRYWSLKSAADIGLRDPFTGSDNDAVDELDQLLRRSVAGQMIADVPLGAFLSGGIDSSTVVAAMQAQSSTPVKTFTIGFHEEGYNEAVHAKAVASHLKTLHTELYVKPEDALAVIPKIPEIYCEPFSDSSQLPTFLLCQLARRHVTVSLSGDGGDELFCGYPRYEAASLLWQKLRSMPPPLRRGAGKVLSIAPTKLLDQLLSWASPALGKTLRTKPTRSRWQTISEVLSAPNFEELYRGVVSHWRQPADIVIGSEEPLVPLTDSSAWLSSPDIMHRMTYLDSISYLPDDILVKVDRAAMGVSLETRVPLLDHRIVEFSWRLPFSMKVRDGKWKWILRQVLYRYVPKELVERPKMGFGVPIDSWLRGPLREWAEALLDESRLKREGYFNPAPIRERWFAHQKNEGDHHYYLWDVLMFQQWLESQSNTRVRR